MSPSDGRHQRCSHYYLLILAILIPTAVSFTIKSPPLHPHSTAVQMASPSSDREAEIRRKILKLKRQGKLKQNDGGSDFNNKMQRPTTSASDDYSDKIKAKLGRKKASMLGLTSEQRR